MVDVNDSDSDEQMDPEVAKDKLFKAVKEGGSAACQEVKYLLDKGYVSSTTETPDKWNPLLWASCNGDEEMVRLLIKFQAHAPYQKSTKMLEESGQTSSSPNLNSDEVHDPFVKPPDSQKVGKYTPLHWAAYKGHLTIVQILMNAELDPRAIDVHGNNAVHQAAASSRIEVMKLFMSWGVDLELQNDRGHSPLDLATDPDIKNLIQKSAKQTKCSGNKCGGAKFSFQNTQFYCQECDQFYCKKCCIRYRVFENVDSVDREKTVCRCESCDASIKQGEQRLKEAMQTGIFEVVDKVFKQIKEDKLDIDVKLNREAEKLHLRLEKELDIRNYIQSVKHNDIYKTIRKSVKTLTDKQENAEKLGVVLDPMLVHEINQCVARLSSERNLRYQMDNTEVPSCNPTSVEELEKLINQAQETSVENEYLDAANKLTTKMKGNIQAREILQMLIDYPQREYPEEVVVLDRNGKPVKNAKDDKKAKKPGKKKKEPPFNTPEWALELNAVQDQVKRIETLSKQFSELHLTKDFLNNVEEQLKRFKKEILFRRQQEEDARLEAEAKALAKKKAAAAKKK